MNSIPKNILAATDFSDTADKAVAFARGLAQRYEAHLHVVHATVILEDPHLDASRRNQLDELLLSDDETRRQELEESYESQHGIEITPHVIRGIAPGEVIVETARSLACDLIVMGTHGRRGLSHLILGSVAERVVRTSVAPVLTVRADAAVNPDGIRKILVPYDFSDTSGQAVRHASAWADALGASLTLLHIVEPVVYPEFYAVDVMSDEMMDRLAAGAEEALDKAAAELTGGEVATEVATGKAARAIVNFADPDTYDLVVMGTRGLSGLEQVLLGSVAESVLRRSRIPLLSIPQH
jgi:nucleotide-binding universal stress UspA family protein